MLQDAQAWITDYGKAFERMVANKTPPLKPVV